MLPTRSSSSSIRRWPSSSSSAWPSSSLLLRRGGRLLGSSSESARPRQRRPLVNVNVVVGPSSSLRPPAGLLVGAGGGVGRGSPSSSSLLWLPLLSQQQRRSSSTSSLTTADVFNTSHPDHRPSASSSTLLPSDLAHRNRLLSSPRHQLASYLVPESDDPLRRPERRSPASAFGARRMPRISVPAELENKLERLVGQQDMALTRRCFQLFLPPADGPTRHPQALPPPKKSAGTNLVPRSPAAQKRTSPQGRVLDLTRQPLKLMPRQTTPELVLSHASAELPSQYAVLRTVMRELQSRLGWDGGPATEGGIQLVDFASGYGAGAWAAAATWRSPRERRNGMVLIEPSPLVGALGRELLKVDTPGPLARWPTVHFRSFAKYLAASRSLTAPRLQTDRSVGLLAFALSALATPQERRRKLKELWHSGVETVVVVEMGHRDGWTAVEEAREFLLALGREEREKGQRQAGEWTGGGDGGGGGEEDADASAEPAIKSGSEVAPVRTRGRRRPGEPVRARPSSSMATTTTGSTSRTGESADPSSSSSPSTTVASHSTPPAPAADGGLTLPPRRQPERFVFNGVEFEESDAGAQGLAEQERRGASGREEVVEWSADGKALVQGGRVLGSYVLAPCPHDQKCPLASTPTPCAFNQLLETPVVTRLTKGIKQDQARLNFSYVILRRGARPEITEADRGEGRLGEVALELLRAEREKQATVAVKGEDGLFAVPETSTPTNEDGSSTGTAEGEPRPEVDYDKLRREIGEWGRVLKAPIHRKGHSEVDLCTADGTVQRTTFSKKLGKQVWYDTAQIQAGDAFPHRSQITQVRERGVDHLSPLHKTNKVSVRSGVVSGLDRLSYVEWKEASEMLAAMGVHVPDYESGKRPKNKRWVVEYADEREQPREAGWEAAHRPERRIDPVAKAQLIKGILAGEEDFEGVTFADTAAETGWRQTRPATDNHENDDPASSIGAAEFEPTPLVGAREVVPSSVPTSSSSSSLSSSTASPWAATNTGMTDLLGDIIAEQQATTTTAGAPAPRSSSGGLNLAASTRVSLAGLGEGWMEEYEANISPADRRAAAHDRQRTFSQMGIPVPDLGRPRTLQDDWELLEKWDGVADRPVKPKRNAFWNRRDWRQKSPRKREAGVGRE